MRKVCGNIFEDRNIQLYLNVHPRFGGDYVNACLCLRACDVMCVLIISVCLRACVDLSRGCRGRECVSVSACVRWYVRVNQCVAPPCIDRKRGPNSRLLLNLTPGHPFTTI